MTVQHLQEATERLQVLQSYSILDTPPEAMFDDLTRLAARMCDTPYAVISLTGEDRQWFKSCVGDVIACGSSLADSLCIHALGEKEILIVPDTRDDARFCNNPRVVQPPYIRFFAGAVLRTPDGVAIGTLCVLSDEPRNLSSDQREALLILARQVMTQLELRRVLRHDCAPPHRAVNDTVPAAKLTTDNQVRLEQLVEERTRELEASNQRLHQEMEERKQAEEALRQAQKMEAIGQLTGGVAHDFNNLLQVIGANLQLLESQLPDSAKRRLEAASGAVDRGAKLAAQLLAFARRQPLEPKATNLAKRLRAMDELLRRTIGADISLTIVIDSALWNTFVDPIQVENVILNLALNARDAMPDGGKLTIEAANAKLDDANAAQHGDADPGEYVMLNISDTGCGMPPELKDRVFEPFFTTKEEGRGTGLGLSQVYGFVKQSKGHISISSTEGEGTTVELYLPRARQREQPREAEVLGGPVEKGDETILVAEDDPEVRETTVDILRELGYKVLHAVDGQNALSIIESGLSIDLLFSDVIMPGSVKAPDLARRAKQIQPDMAVLFTSGYTQNTIEHDGRLNPGVDLLRKPYSREQLAGKIRHVLRNRAQRMTAREAKAGPAAERAVAKAGLNILMVEDDQEVLQLISTLVREMGHAVVECTHAEQALAELGKERFNVLFTDIGLPDISGIELARCALRAQPSLHVIFASGYGVNINADDLPEEQVTTLPKPYNMAEIAQVLQPAPARERV